MKAKMIFFLLSIVFILSFSLASCSKEEKDENTDCGCEKTETQAAPDTLGISNSI